MEHWNWRQRSIAVVLWPAFLAACLGTFLFFARVDATQLHQAFVFDAKISDQAVYSIGFLFFWFIAIVACTLSTWLIRTERRVKDFPVVDEDSGNSD
jgi:hypothetical protein